MSGSFTLAPLGVRPSCWRSTEMGVSTEASKGTDQPGMSGNLGQQGKATRQASRRCNVLGEYWAARSCRILYMIIPRWCSSVCHRRGL
jgi:hypothetical protein